MKLRARTLGWGRMDSFFWQRILVNEKGKSKNYTLGDAGSLGDQHFESITW